MEEVVEGVEIVETFVVEEGVVEGVVIVETLVVERVDEAVTGRVAVVADTVAST